MLGIFAYLCISILFELLSYYLFRSGYYDLGTFEYSFSAALKNPSYIQSLILPTGDSLIGHTSPFLILLLPLYVLWPAPQLLLILGPLALGASVIPLYLLSIKRLESRRLASLFCITLLVNPLFHDSIAYDFHPIGFVPLFILSALYFYERESYLGFLVFIWLANSTHEFVSILTAFLAFALLAKQFGLRKNISYLLEQKSTRTALVALFTSGAWFLSAVLIQSYFNPHTPITNFLFVSYTQNSLSQKFFYIVVAMFGSLMFLPLLEPLLLLPVLPYVTVVLLSTHDGYWSIFSQYGAFTVPFLFYAVLVGLKRMGGVRPNIHAGTARKVIILLLVCNVVFAGATFVSALTGGPTYANAQAPVFSHDWFLNSMILSLPGNASVLTQGEIYPHLSFMAEVGLYIGNISIRGRVLDHLPDFIILDVTMPSFYKSVVLFGYPRSSSSSLSNVLPSILSNNNYSEYVAADGAYILAHRNLTQVSSPAGAQAIALNAAEKWSGTGSYQVTSNQINLSGGIRSGASLYDTGHYLSSTSFSVSYALQQPTVHGQDSWAGLVLGYKDSKNYQLLMLRSSNLMSLIRVVNGASTETVLGAVPDTQNGFQYFYLKIQGGSLDIYINSNLRASITLEPSSFAGYMGFANWQEDTRIFLPLLTEF